LGKFKKPDKLVDILTMRDDDLVPAFLRALVENGQRFIARKLGYKGLDAFVVLPVVILHSVTRNNRDHYN